jgi:putative flippase GtrA
MFRLALIKFKRKPEEAVMIGDQLMTDILGANRAGIDAIWVRKMEGKEFVGTRVNRLMERILQSIVYKALVTPAGAVPRQASVAVQAAKFVIVGLSSFAIDFFIRWTLTFHVPWGNDLLSNVFGRWLQNNAHIYVNSEPHKAAVPFFVAIAASLAIVNSFLWNRLWTFEIRGKEERAAQFRRFVLVSVVGLGLNVAISSGLNNIITGHAQRSLFISTVIAAAIVAIWNFTGQRLYAFQAHKR